MSRLNLEDNRATNFQQWSGSWGGIRQILTQAYVISSRGPIKYFFDANGSDRIVALPNPTAVSGRFFFIANVGTSNNLALQDHLGASLGSIAVGQAGLCICSALEWIVLFSGVITVIGGVTTTRIVTAAGAVGIGVTDASVALNKTVGAATTVNLPSVTVRSGLSLHLLDWKGDAGTNNITIVPAVGETIMGQASWTIAADYGSVLLRPSTELSGWTL